MKTKTKLKLKIFQKLQLKLKLKNKSKRKSHCPCMAVAFGSKGLAARLEKRVARCLCPVLFHFSFVTVYVNYTIFADHEIIFGNNLPV